MKSNLELMESALNKLEGGDSDLGISPSDKSYIEQLLERRNDNEDVIEGDIQYQAFNFSASAGLRPIGKPFDKEIDAWRSLKNVSYKKTTVLRVLVK